MKKHLIKLITYSRTYITIMMKYIKKSNTPNTPNTIDAVGRKFFYVKRKINSIFIKKKLREFELVIFVKK